MESKAGFFSWLICMQHFFFGGFLGHFVNEDLEDLIDKVFNMFFLSKSCLCLRGPP